jgi:hypothetical protein
MYPGADLAMRGLRAIASAHGWKERIMLATAEAIRLIMIGVVTIGLVIWEGRSFLSFIVSA